MTSNLFDHTYDIHLDYVKCPQCDKIQENRQAYAESLQGMTKSLSCKYCQNEWIQVKKSKNAPVKFLPNASRHD